MLTLPITFEPTGIAAPNVTEPMAFEPAGNEPEIPKSVLVIEPMAFEPAAIVTAPIVPEPEAKVTVPILFVPAGNEPEIPNSVLVMLPIALEPALILILPMVFDPEFRLTLPIVFEPESKPTVHVPSCEDATTFVTVTGKGVEFDTPTRFPERSSKPVNEA